MALKAWYSGLLAQRVPSCGGIHFEWPSGSFILFFSPLLWRLIKPSEKGGSISLWGSFGDSALVEGVIHLVPNTPIQNWD